jgi:uncharacterized protein
MLIPSTACPAECSYCFGPHFSGERMSDEVLHYVMEWIGTIPQDEPLDVTFHGGEPLTAGLEYYRRALPLLREVRKNGRIRISIQSNLWLLSADYLDLFEEFRVHLGTSLDGPEEINDNQRGRGYFRKTMAKLDLVRERGLSSGCIVTLSAHSAPHWREIIRFFEHERLNISLHAALPGLQKSKNKWLLSPDAYGIVMGEIFEDSLAHDPLINIEPIESMIKGMASGGAGSCLFGDCLGKFLAVGPDGAVYPCQRFVGLSNFRLSEFGSLSAGILDGTSTWRMLAQRQEMIASECGDCAFWELCHGGCPYNALAAGKGTFQNGLRDPYCKTYKILFTAILERAAEEFFSEENLAAVVENPMQPDDLLRVGVLSKRMKLR